MARKGRLQKMAHYFDAYRIDHILGFFRIWEIPMDAVQGILGYFNPALPLTKEEIEEWSIPFDRERMTQPYIRHHILLELFEEYADEVIKAYLTPSENDEYKLKDSFNTQQKVNQHFLKDVDEDELSDKNRLIRDGLFEKVKPDMIFALHIAPFDSSQVAVKPDEMFAFREQILEVVLKPPAKDLGGLNGYMRAMSTHSRESLTAMTQLTDTKGGILNSDTHLKNYFFISGQSLNVDETGSQPVIRARIYASGRQVIAEKIEELKAYIETLKVLLQPNPALQYVPVKVK